MAEQRRPRHLMDPSNPVRPVNDARLTRVQQWVISVLVVFTVAHLVVGVVVAAVMMEPEHQTSRVGLVVMSALFGLLGLGGGFLIHRRSPLNPWMVFALVPAAVGLVLVL